MLVSLGSDLCPSANCPFSSKLTFRVRDSLGSTGRLQVTRGGTSEFVGRKAFHETFSPSVWGAPPAGPAGNGPAVRVGPAGRPFSPALPRAWRTDQRTQVGQSLLSPSLVQKVQP